MHKLIKENYLLSEVAVFGRAAHDSIGQTRKYTGEPYWTHTERVAGILIDSLIDLYGIVGFDTDMVAGLLLHDVVEDVFPKNPDYSLKRIYNEFGPVIAGYVHDLTDVYTKEAFPQYNRRQRHEQERIRMCLINDKSKVMKACDIRDNTEDISLSNPGYAKSYIPEKIVAAQELSKSFSDLKLKKIFHFILDETTIVGQSLPRR